MSNYRWQWKSRRIVLAVTFLLNDVNRSIFFLPGLVLMLQAESRVREKAFSEWQMRNVSSSYRHIVPIWNGGVIAGRCFVFFLITHVCVGVAETVGWWDEQNEVSYGDDDNLFQYLSFELLVLPLMMLIVAVLSTPAAACGGGVRDVELSCIFLFS